MSTLDNPAGRLLELIQKAKVVNEQHDNRPAKAGWAEVFGVPYEKRNFVISKDHEEELIN